MSTNREFSLCSAVFGSSHLRSPLSLLARVRADSAALLRRMGLAWLALYSERSGLLAYGQVTQRGPVESNLYCVLMDFCLRASKENELNSN